MFVDDLIIKFGKSPWNPRGKYRLYKILGSVVGQVQGVTPKGVRLKFRADDISPYYHFREDYENQLADLIAALPPGGIYVDVGANMGNYTILASRRLGREGLAVAYEPVAATYAQLIHHLKINHAANVIPLNVAVSAAAGVAEIVVSDNSGLSYLGKVERDGFQKVQRVATVTLDQSLPQLIGDRAIDLIKIDVEGLEFEVLRGAKGLLESRRIKQIHVEISASNVAARGAASRTEVWAFLENHGYRPRFRRTEDVMYDEIFDLT